MAQVQHTYNHAFAPGTTANLHRQAYLLFMSENSFEYKFPTLSAILMYVQYLANLHKNIRSVKNYASGAKSYVRHVAGDCSPFDSYVLINLIKGIARLSSHIPSRPLTLTAVDLRRCADD